MGIITDLSKIIGGKSKKRGAKRARKAGEAGWQEAQKMIGGGEARARADEAPYREAGATALDALMSMTGLGVTNYGQRAAERTALDYAGEYDSTRTTPDEYINMFRKKLGKGNRKRLDQYLATNPYQSGYTDDNAYLQGFSSVLGSKGRNKFSRYQQRFPIIGRAIGGPMQPYGEAGPDNNPLYNVNENGPENVFTDGAVARNDQPQTLAPSEGGYVQPNENPGGMEGGYNFQTDPGYEFRFNEGMRALERGAAQRGGLLSGGYGRKAIRYGQNYASEEYNNVYNRIANIAGLGQVSTGRASNYALQGAFGRADARGNEAAYRASGLYAQGLHQGQITEDFGRALDNAWGEYGGSIRDLFRDRNPGNYN